MRIFVFDSMWLCACVENSSYVCKAAIFIFFLLSLYLQWMHGLPIP